MTTYATGQPYPQPYELVRHLHNPLKSRAAQNPAYLAWTKAWLSRPATGGNSVMWGKDSLKHLKRVVVQARAKGLVGEPVYRYAITDARFFADTREDAGEPIAAMGFRLIANKLEGGNYPAGVFHAVEIPTSFDR